MIAVGIYIYTNNIVDLSGILIENFALRVAADSGTFENNACLLNQLEALGGYYGESNQASRVELFSDEKISVNSSIQNINDISKTFTDFSQTFTVPASKQNNKIFRHWYENSNDNGFSTLIKADAYIELDTILFRTGKIQLESANVKNGQPQDYSITFIGALGSLKDKFNGTFLKDLTTTDYDFAYSGTAVKNKVVTTAASANIMFPLISSSRYWNYNEGGDDDITVNSHPIRFNELFPAIKLSVIFDMINTDTKWNLNFNGSFLTDARFTNAYLWLKNAETFDFNPTFETISFQTIGVKSTQGGNPINLFQVLPLINNVIFSNGLSVSTFYSRTATLTITPTVAGIIYIQKTYLNNSLKFETSVTSIAGAQTFPAINIPKNSQVRYEISSESTMTFNSSVLLVSKNSQGSPDSFVFQTISKSSNQTLSVPKLAIKSYMPEIKIEDFFTGILKMFNLTCFSTDSENYTIMTLEDFYTTGDIIDLTKYIKSDTTNLTRVKSYKKINFEYEKSESLVNVGFNSANGIEYGFLFYNTGNDGEEYNIKLPFEDLNFNNLQDKLQVGYALKTDLQKYIPKPIILYDYNPSALTSLTGTAFHFSNATSGNGTSHTAYKAFGQEFFNGTDTFSLNFNEQQSTLTNELIDNSLYNEYYDNYIANIFNAKARLIKVSAILPTSLLTSLKLNDRIIIRDKRYLINTMTTDLTTGEVQFELLTDFREL